MKGLMMDYPLTTNSMLDFANRVFSHKEIITILPDKGRHQYSFHDFYVRTKKLASALVSFLSIRPGDRVGTFAWNQYQHLELYYAVPGVAAVCHTINIRLSIEQISFIINHAGDKVIFVDATLVPLIESIAQFNVTVQSYVVMNAPAGFTTTLPNFIEYERLMAFGTEEFEWIPVEETDACAMCYTSGTTGNPKGVLYSHRSTYLHALTCSTPNILNLKSRDRILVIVPMFHAMAWAIPFCSILSGADLIFPTCHLQAEKLVDILFKEKPNIAYGVPTIWAGIYEELVRNPRNEKLSLKELVCGGSALPKSLIKGFWKNFGVHSLHAWGMTEISPVGTACRLQRIHQHLSEEEQFEVLAKQGIELPGIEIKLVTEDGKEAPRDGKTMGEILIRGHWVASGYYNVQRDSSFVSDDGWLKTGDVATIDQFGYLQITDRTKDLIKSGGEWISSVSLEVALMAHPKIREACVIAIPHEKWAERPLACIVPVENEDVDQSEMREYLQKHFAHYQIPDNFVLVKEIPKTSVGKFDKKELRRRFSANELI